jgi:2-keto-3-deoxy-L-rhamnonate aldolase RhmA
VSVAATRLKDRLRAGEAVHVLNPDYPNGALIEYLSRPELRVDAVMIDTEQGNAGIERVDEVARVARLCGLCCLVRVFSPEPWVIERILSRGVDGIVVPRLDSAAAASAVVDVVRYCFPTERASKVVVIQVESAQAHRELDAILAVDGLDALFVGPVDLARSMGYGGDYAAHEVEGAIVDILTRSRAAGRAAGMMVKPTDRRSWREAGAQFLYFHLNDWIGIGARNFPAA